MGRCPRARGAVLAVGAHGRGKGVLAPALQGHGHAQQLGLVHAVGAHDLAHHGRALGHGAGLVQHDLVDVAGSLQCLGRLDQHPVGGAAARAHHDRGGRGQAKGARAADHQHRHGMAERDREARAQDHPDNQRQSGDTDHRGHEHARDAVGHALDGGLGARGLVHQAHDRRKRGVLADGSRLHGKPTAGRHGRTRHAVSDVLLGRHGFARDRALVHQRRALYHDAVDRDPLAGSHDDAVAHDKLLGRHRDLGVISHDGRGLGRQVHQRRHGVGRLALGARLEVLAQGNQRQDHAGRVQVQPMRGPVRRREVARAKRPGHAVERRQAVGERRRRAQRDQRVHVGRAVPQRAEPAREDPTVGHQDRHAQQELGQRPCHHVAHAVQPRHLGPAQHRPHGQVEQRYREERAGHKAHQDVMRGLARLLGRVRRRRAAPLARGGTTHGAVPHLFDRGHHGGRRCGIAIVVELHRVLEQVDPGVCHAGHAGRGPLHARRARRAGHPPYVERLPHWQDSPPARGPAARVT